MVSKETVEKGDHVFTIKRRLFDGYFQKSISYLDETGGKQTHIEQVRAWTLKELTELLLNFGFRVDKVFGDYELGEYTKNSPRCILVARKL